MKKITRRIKGILITLIVMGLLGSQLNLTISEESNQPAKKVSIIEYWIPNVHAATDVAECLEKSTNEEIVACYKEKNGGDEELKKKTDPKEFLERTARLTRYVNMFFDPLIHFFTFKIGALLNNDYIYQGKMQEMLQAIWRTNRNIVNIIFVLILLYLALKYIFAGDGENTDLKKVLPTFAIMLIAVNFSWMASKVILDAANVTTNIAFSLPAATKRAAGAEAFKPQANAACKTNDSNGRTTGMCIPTRMFNPVETTLPPINLNAETQCTPEKIKELTQAYKEAYPEGGGEPTTDLGKKYHGVAVFCWKEVDIGNFNQNNASYHLSYSMGQVQKLTEASKSDAVKLSIGVLFALVLQIIYLVTMAALFFVMLVRIGVLWLFVALSPLLVLLMFVKKNLSEVSMEGDNLSIGTFISWAFAPAKVGIVWSIGFSMVSAGQAASIKFLGKASESAVVESDGSGGMLFDVETIFMGMKDLDQFIWLLMTIVIIWMGTFAVLTKLKFVDGMMNKINEAGTTFAKLVAESPTWAPILPVYDPQTKQWQGKAVTQVIPNFNEMINKYKNEQKGDGDATKGAFKTAGKNLEDQGKTTEGQAAIRAAAADTNRTLELLVKHGFAGNTQALRDLLKDGTRRGQIESEIKNGLKDNTSLAGLLITSMNRGAGAVASAAAATATPSPATTTATGGAGNRPATTTPNQPASPGPVDEG